MTAKVGYPSKRVGSGSGTHIHGLGVSNGVMENYAISGSPGNCRGVPTSLPPPPSPETITAVEHLFEATPLGDSETQHMIHDVAHVTLVLADERPSAKVTFPVTGSIDITSSSAYQFHNNVSLPTRLSVTESADSSTDRGRTRGELLVSRDKSALDSYASTREYVGEASRLGELLGYPEDSVDWFVATDGQSRPQEFRDFLAPLIEHGTVSPEQAKYLGHVPYIPAPSISAVEEAVDRGRRYYDTLKTAAEEWDVSCIERVADGVLAREEREIEKMLSDDSRL